ncbi:hypothetical protein BDQ17DRAFT_1374374 [Cyathus striatus]|nr:hypothetical protein BDQ17DRAFT_1374374 [Cyathus striatus]
MALFPYRLSPATVFAVLPVFFLLRRLLKSNTPLRPSKVAKETERVVILGASSGIGRSIAHLYAERGAHVFIVGRREYQVNEVVDECKQRSGEWNGLDTLVVAAGVSSLRPLMAVACVDDDGHNGVVAPQATQEGLQTTVNVAEAALRGNFIGPLVSAVSFIPLLTLSSRAPSITLISSVASLIPAPTRSLYCSTKSASLVLFQSLSIEHPKIAFTHILPATPTELDPNTHGMKPEEVARRTVDAIDRAPRRVYAYSIRFAHLVYWIWPAFIERKARDKYNFSS